MARALARRPRRPRRRRRGGRHPGVRRRARRSSSRSPASTCTAGRSRRCSGRRCPPLAEVLRGRPAGRSSSRTSSTTPTSGRCSAAPRRSGVDAVLVTPRCADPLYRRSIRVSMGTVFQVPWTRIDPWPGGVEQLQRAGLHDRGPRARGRLGGPGRPRRRPAAAAGARARHRGRRAVAPHDRGVDVTVRIPMRGGVDSLNVAAAGAVAAWALRVRD